MDIHKNILYSRNTNGTNRTDNSLDNFQDVMIFLLLRKGYKQSSSQLRVKYITYSNQTN